MASTHNRAPSRQAELQDRASGRKRWYEIGPVEYDWAGKLPRRTIVDLVLRRPRHKHWVAWLSIVPGLAIGLTRNDWTSEIVGGATASLFIGSLIWGVQEARYIHRQTKAMEMRRIMGKPRWWEDHDD